MDNTALFYLIYNLSNQSEILDTLMIFAARYLIIITFLLITIFAFRGNIREKKAFILAIFCLITAVVIIKIIHLFFIETRPFVSLNLTPLYPYDPDPSFPSRHVTMMTAITSAYIYFKSKWAMLFLVFLILTGISRIYVGVHYPLDILGGFLVGIISLILAKQIIKLLKIRFSLI